MRRHSWTAATKGRTETTKTRGVFAALHARYGRYKADTGPIQTAPPRHLPETGFDYAAAARRSICRDKRGQGDARFEGNSVDDTRAAARRKAVGARTDSLFAGRCARARARRGLPR